MTIINWIELICSECGAETFGGPRFREDFNANTLRAAAKKQGWKLEREDGLNFDLCSNCAKGRAALTDASAHKEE